MMNPISKNYLRLLCAAVFFLVAFGTARACTSLLLGTASGGHVYGRTMEFGFELDSDVIFMPRKMAVVGTGPAGQPGKPWVSKYAMVGMNAFDMPIVCDGINEKGLAGGILYFPGYAQYTPDADATASKCMAPWEFLAWALGNFATVEEVKAALDGVEIIGAKMPHLGAVPPFHYTLHDATGKSIVIEPTGGKLVVFDNPYGVMTNSPTFDWHLTNLRNYVKLTPVNVPPMKVAGQTVDSFGQGSGWLGIPGDPTPPSRLIRALAFSMTSDQKPNGIESVRLVEHIMNNFDIPYGTIRNPKPGGDLDYTQWTTIADIQELVYYVKTYNNQMLVSIPLADFDFDAKAVSTAAIKDDLVAPKLFPAK